MAADLSLSPIKMENGGMNPPSAYHGLEGPSYPFLNTEVCLKCMLLVLVLLVEVVYLEDDENELFLCPHTSSHIDVAKG